MPSLNFVPDFEVISLFDMLASFIVTLFNIVRVNRVANTLDFL